MILPWILGLLSLPTNCFWDLKVEEVHLILSRRKRRYLNCCVIFPCIIPKLSFCFQPRKVLSSCHHQEVNVLLLRQKWEYFNKFQNFPLINLLILPKEIYPVVLESRGLWQRSMHAKEKLLCWMLTIGLFKCLKFSRSFKNHMQNATKQYIRMSKRFGYILVSKFNQNLLIVMCIQQKKQSVYLQDKKYSIR